MVRNMKMIWGIIVLIGLTAPIISCLPEYLANPNVYSERKVLVSVEYEKIENPARSIEKYKKEYNKITKRWISSKYEAALTKDEIKTYFNKELREKGWDYKMTTKEGEIHYIKNDLLCVIVPNDYEYSLGVHDRRDGPNF